jgi:F0F1-type ATP synthase assembly protein I
MKKICFIVALVTSLSWNSFSQCIDALITTKGDTIFGILVSSTDTTYIIDSYNFVISLHSDMIAEHIKCFREAAREDSIRMKQLDYLTEKDLLKYTPGYYLRKASRNFYLGLSLDLVGGIAMGVSLGSFKNASKSTQKWVIFSGGTVAVAGGIFFLLRSFYFIDKTGKLLDLERSSIYLEPTSDGKIGIIWKF